jgi:peptide deformylase
MAVQSIRILGEPVLHQPADVVEGRSDGSFPHHISALIADMHDTLAASKGVGLAAPQVGVGLRIFVFDCPEERGQPQRHRGVVINPRLKTSEVLDVPPRPDDDEEGCLSAPGVKFPIVRADCARVTGFDAQGGAVELQGTGLIARMLQHEMAHLDGVLYLDQLAEPHAERARRAVETNQWGVPGLSWTPGTVPDPFQH